MSSAAGDLLPYDLAAIVDPVGLGLDGAGDIDRGDQIACYRGLTAAQKHPEQRQRCDS